MSISYAAGPWNLREKTRCNVNDDGAGVTLTLADGALAPAPLIAITLQL
jgi:hypothetical protein